MSRWRIVDCTPEGLAASARAEATAGLQQVIAQALQPLPRPAYDALERVNISTLLEMGRSPAHYRQALLREGPSTPAQTRGTLVHRACFEPEAFAESVVVWRGGRRAGKEWDAFRAANAGRDIVNVKEHSRILELQHAVRSHPGAAAHLSGGAGELTLQWLYETPALAPEQFSVACKGRLDYLTASAICDLKVTRDASPEGFARECWRYSNHVRAAWYVDGHRIATGVAKPFVLVAVEAAPPHVVQVYRVPDAVLDAGRARYQDLLGRLHACRTSGQWPGYSTGEMELELPRWAVPFDDTVEGLDLDLTGLTNNESEAHDGAGL